MSDHEGRAGQLLERPARAQAGFERAVRTGKVTRERHTENIVRGHLTKARRNLSFVQAVQRTYPDWALVGCYYASYHAVMALLASRGYLCKDHEAALCGLIVFFSTEITPGDLHVLTYQHEEVLQYAAARDERQNASYSTSTLFAPETVREMQAGAISFVRKAELILNKA